MATKSENTSALLSAQREQLIAEAAYYRAARRGFCGGDEIEDWLMSEIEIDSVLMQNADSSASAAEKASLLHRLEDHLHHWDQRIEEFIVLATRTGSILSTEIHDQVTDLVEKRALARQKISALRDLSAEAWYDVRDHTIHFFDDMHAAVERLAARLTKSAKSEDKKSGAA